MQLAAIFYKHHAGKAKGQSVWTALYFILSIVLFNREFL